ncbi:hypothetical protein LTR96_011047 [Exophiala xenobiotica]|nr:hypothetical protein LTR41_011142 [Exophiala xenobiotica]KAK5215410.1 hypothetical protein LTR72_011533 [Exophiala xenobiotica]KAK5220800.1 hypothetical protein LTR47_011149 [Exophiala xenobiotica]KAK5245252.1 hypothetical protein LTS06_009304 [Exophiala xenobiotica]KAK5263566.1 hypothetical protein LTR96_011047 [Exophiala xenobiotica]
MASSKTGGSSNNRFKIVQHALRSPTDDILKSVRDKTTHATVKELEASLLKAGRSTDADRVKLANVLADAVHDNLELATTILDDQEVTSTREVALRYGFSRVKGLVSKEQPLAAHSIAASTSAARASEPDKTAALQFRQRLFETEPTAVLQQMLSTDDSRDANDDIPIHPSARVRNEVANLLDQRPDFNIRTTSVLKLLHEDHANIAHLDSQTRSAVTESLKVLQRTQALTPALTAVKPLLEQGLTSAMRVSAVPKKQFITRVAPQLVKAGTSTDRAENLAAQIHDHAAASRLRADSALIQLHQMVKGSGLKPIDGEFSVEKRRAMVHELAGDTTGTPAAINLDALFGDMDMCECEACLDVTSPTAYYVDLLQYLRNNDLDSDSKWDNTGKEGIKGTALERLFQRRPDLKHLQLTCVNANTALPIIDLANEVMEAFTIHAKAFIGSGQVVIETWNVSNETTEELLASPSNTRKKAYCILKESVYPVSNLPYFQPLDASRLYLGYLGTSRYELIDTFRLAHRQWPVRAVLVSTPEKLARYAALRAQIQDRAAAAENLGLSPDEYVIITRESLWPIECSEFADSGSIIDVEDYRKDIGVLDTFAYWGYDNNDLLLSVDQNAKTGLTFVKSQFLVRSGLSFADTADLVRTNYVNPMMPIGRNKILLDSIRFSYRFLQHMTVGLTDAGQKHQTIANFLFSAQPWVQYILLQQIPPTGNSLVKPVVDTPTFKETEINCPCLPVEGYLVWKPPILERVAPSNSAGPTTEAEPQVLGFLDNAGELTDEKGELVGLVWMNSLVYYGGLQPIRTSFPGGRISLIQTAKKYPTPTYEELDDIPVTTMPVLVDAESILIWSDRRPPAVPWSIPPDSCSIEHTELLHLNGKPLEPWEWDRINRFIRLYKRLQQSSWTIQELDAALVGLWKVPEIPLTPSTPSSSGDPHTDEDAGFSFSHFKDKGCADGEGDGNEECDDCDDSTCVCDPSNFINISPGFIKQLMSIKQLAELTDQDLEKLLCLWSDIGTFGDKSLYSRLFLTHNLQAMDTVFSPDSNGNYLSAGDKIGDHTPVIVAALRLKASIFDRVLQRVGLTRDSLITITNLTKLYRHVLLSTMLSIKPEALLQALDLWPDPYQSASVTLDMYQLWSRISSASFTIPQLRYITSGLDDPLRPIGPTPVTVLRTTQAIMDGLKSIDAAQPDLTAQEEAVLTTAVVKSKAILIFAPSVVDDIVVGLIEGSHLYTTNAPVGLVVDSKKISPKIVYKDPLTPPSRRAKLSVTGCLADTELAEAVALFPGNQEWASALQRLRKQAENLVTNELKDLFAESMDEAVETLTQGDVAAVKAAGTDPGNPGTAVMKRVYFMQRFMPYLREYLESNFIITTMSSVASVAAETCSWLLSEVIKIGPAASQSTAMQVLRGLKSLVANDPSATWSGFLIPPSSDSYAFSGYGQGDTAPKPLVLGGESIPFTIPNEDPSDLWWTDPVPLVGGKLVTFKVEAQKVPGDLQWKTARSGVVVIPSSALVPDSSVDEATGIFAPLLKASMVVQGFSLNLTELQYLQGHGERFSNFTLNNINFDAWKRLLQYYELRSSIVSREKSLIDLFKWADLQDTATADEIAQMVSDVTTWDKNSIKILLKKKNLDLWDVKLFRDEASITKLGKIFAFIGKVGISDVNLLLSWTDLKLDFQPTWKMAKSIRQTIRGKYTASDYEQAIKPSHDQLRKNQRDALIAYLLVLPAIQQWGVQDADGLFEFFLLDVQMGSCMQTSRTKQAISSVQLFVQRCILGLEEKYEVDNEALDAERWQWMSKQTVWTANRKVFLWPENWMIPSLRDDKTPIYTEMESELLQRDVNPSNVLESFKTYVTKLDQIAHLRAIGVYVEQQDTNKIVFHCIAMTIGSPYLFFYRSYDFFAHEWIPWIRVTVDIPTYTIEYSTAPLLHISPTSLAETEEGPSLADAETDDETNTGFAQQKDSFTGCYVTPVVWQNRRLLFIGEITEKAVPNETANTTTFGELTKPSSTASANSLAPLSLWEIKVSWTEYRSGKWTNKQTASEPFQTASFDNNNRQDIDTFQFMPQIATPSGGTQYVNIEIWRADGVNSWFQGNYVFNGSIIQKGSMKTQTRPKNWTPTSFHLVGGRSMTFTASSLQKTDDGKVLFYLNAAPYVKYDSDDLNGVIQYAKGFSDIFYHPFSANLVSAASVANDVTNIDPIEGVYQNLTPKFVDAAFGTGPAETDADGASRPTFGELSKPYTNYNWELGFFAPIEVANTLLAGQQFDQALDMIHHVFNPYADGKDITRVWNWYPFKKSSSKMVLETILNQLKPRQSDQKITKWRDHPFQPFVVARGRTVAYMKWTIMLYIKVLIAYGDMYFRRRTLEDIPLAIQIQSPVRTEGREDPQARKEDPQTYFSLLDKWDAFSNAAVQLEIAFPFSSQTPFPWGVSDDDLAVAPVDVKQIALANLFGFATSSYFCLPSNPELQALRSTIDQRLYNIRNCLDIDGRPLPLVLWDPPLDPADVVAAVASGLSLSSALNDLNTSLPNYRFTWLIARALELTGELKSLEATFLSIKEKRDSEALQLLRTGHELSMNKMVMAMKKLQLEEANKTLAALRAGQESPKARFDFYSRLAGVNVPPLGSTSQPFTGVNIDIEPPAAGDTHLNSTELQEETQAIIAQVWNGEVALLEIVAGILHALPSFNVHGTPMGCGIEVAWGMPNIAAAAQASARVFQTYASDANFSSSQAGRKAGHVKQFQDRVHQMNLAGLEFEHMNSQMDAQNTRIAIANRDIANQQQLIDNAQQVNDFLQNKYTNDDLYTYLESTMRTAMYQTYLLAYDLAKKAELAFRFERRPTNVQGSVDFVSFGYFNPARDGLQASHQLYLALKSMDLAYQESRGHDYEMTKSVSLRQLNPYQLLTLRETGSCTFNVPEVAFDMDFPGHFYRRIKTVTLTVPCVVGPHIGVNATLRLVKHRYRANPLAMSSGEYVEDTSSGGLDPRFHTDIIPIDAVATSTAQNDSGVFELSLKDERFVPFEGAGAISTWELTLPPTAFRPFNYASIADVILSMRYTACDGGEMLRKAASGSVVSWVGAIEEASKEVGLLALWDVRAEFATEWAKLSAPQSNGGNDVRTLVLRNLNGRLPAFVAGRDSSKVRANDVSLVTTLGFTQAADLAIDFKYVAGSSTSSSSSNATVFDSGPSKIGGLNMFRITTADDEFGDWGLKLTISSAIKVDSSSRMWLVVRYKLIK